MKILTCLIIVLFSFGALAIESTGASAKTTDNKDQKDKKKNPLVESDLNQLQKEVVTEPTFSSESADQEKIDKNLQKSNEVMSAATKMHILEAKKCGKLGSTEAIIACQKQVQTSKLSKK
ncbi:MAG: hypothetical protein H7281_12675 [Bacteriovorax sp.]|nr:hypothetical protein [Bacteriovorax sp.]